MSLKNLNAKIRIPKVLKDKLKNKRIVKIYNEFESITLGIVGGDYGSDSQKLMEKKHSKFLYSKDIKWFGSVSHDELRNYYNASKTN